MFSGDGNSHNNWFDPDFDPDNPAYNYTLGMILWSKS